MNSIVIVLASTQPVVLVSGRDDLFRGSVVLENTPFGPTEAAPASEGLECESCPPRFLFCVAEVLHGKLRVPSFRTSGARHVTSR